MHYCCGRCTIFSDYNIKTAFHLIVITFLSKWVAFARNFVVFIPLNTRCKMLPVHFPQHTNCVLEWRCNAIFIKSKMSFEWMHLNSSYVGMKRIKSNIKSMLVNLIWLHSTRTSLWHHSICPCDDVNIFKLKSNQVLRFLHHII